LRDDQAETQNFWGSLNAPKVLFLRLRMRILGIVVMSLNGCRGLRAKRRFLRFARKMQIPVTGKTAISGICP
jgi:CTP synthase (UTP-ammonia lyase)